MPAARRRMAMDRQQLLATMVLMGINRLIVTDGKISASCLFELDTTDAITAVRRDGVRASTRQTRQTAEGLGLLVHPVRGAAHDLALQRQHVQLDRAPSRASRCTRRLAGNVDINFRSETFPLERMADLLQIQEIEEKAPVAATPAAAPALPPIQLPPPPALPPLPGLPGQTPAPAEDVSSVLARSHRRTWSRGAARGPGAGARGRAAGGVRARGRPAAARPARRCRPCVTATPDVLRALGALYFAARLDETGLLQAVEWLVQRARRRCACRVSTAARLEDIARRRAAGAGARPARPAVRAAVRPSARRRRATPAAPGHASSRCSPRCARRSSPAACGRPARRAIAPMARSPTPRASSRWRPGHRLGGGVALFVPRVDDAAAARDRRAVGPGRRRARRAADLLGDADARCSGRAPPTIRRLLDIGRNGQQVLRWVADVAGRLADPAGAAPAVPSIAVTSAAGWLQACGLALPPRREGWV